MNKYEKAFEEIGNFKLDLDEWNSFVKIFFNDTQLTLYDIMDSKLSDQLILIHEAFDKAALYDALQHEQQANPIKPNLNDKSEHQLGERCPRCGSDRTYVASEMVFAVQNEPYVDIDGNLCRNTPGGTSTIKCYKCGTTWNQNVKPLKVILKQNPRAFKK